MIHIKSRKLICRMGMLLMIGVSMTGCKGKPDKNGTMISDDGRKYGGVIECSMSDGAETAFFDFKVEEAAKLSAFQFDDGLYKAPEGNTYLVLKVTISNTYEKDLPMSITDFVLDYDGNKGNEKIFGYGNSDIHDSDFMDNVFTLKKGESITKNILFNVKDKKQYQIKYSEYYEDQFEGNCYIVDVDPVEQ